MHLRGRLDLHSIEAVGHVIGMMAVFTGVAGLIISIGLAVDFSVQQNALSDLGVADGTVAWLFNGTLVVSGALAAVFFGTLVDRFENRYQRIGGVLLALAGLSLLAAGLFPSGHALHLPASVAFFVAITAGILVGGYGDREHGRSRRATIAFNLVLLHVIAWVFGALTLDGSALPALVGGLVYAIWIILLVIQRGRDLPT